MFVHHNKEKGHFHYTGSLRGYNQQATNATRNMCLDFVAQRDFVTQMLIEIPLVTFLCQTLRKSTEGRCDMMWRFMRKPQHQGFNPIYTVDTLI